MSYKEKKSKNAYKKRKMKISKKQKNVFFLVSQGSLNPKIRFLGQKVCPVARGQTDRHTHTKVNAEDTLSVIQDFMIFYFNLYSMIGPNTFLV